ncbi:50S ribosomal protein L32 [Candidatus Uhrbacteria bacterium RIFOXYC2_FULL_47_19]|uniref:Large ribosomal subunit protein bL32 n=1 Tax=Candidatus Uhrbacteria bacterium RIFOXYC2_FULL_47_19 TaxID=1802424 RepID=A0A1F7WG86_9BACT|nr:MAG: 50S ribosomal protein L32 [Candidatus Uhrbacteria bacterium RIFOXYC2_FULL_47_19]
MQHNACNNCGSYSGRQVLKLDNPLEKKTTKTTTKSTKPTKASKTTASKKKK